MSESHPTEHATSSYFANPPLSDWQCEMFGGAGIVWRPLKREEPNAFWRLMQFLVFGNRWRKVAP